MDVNSIEIGMRVKVTKDDGTKGMFIDPKILRNRGVGKVGIIKSFVPGHGGDVWFVLHPDGMAAYCYTEIEPA